MPQLLQVISEFRAGKLDQPRLFARAEEFLDDDGANLDVILGALQEEHTRMPLPLGTLVALRKHLIASAAPKTQILIEPPRPPSPLPIIASPAEDAAAKQAIGATLAGRFRLVEFIGSGGTSRLYKAVDQRKVEAGAADPHVAVKVLTYPFKDTLEALAVLHRETEGTQKLSHPNIVRVIDCDRDGDLVFMTMEFIGGKTLHALLRTSRFLGSGRTEAWSIIRDIAGAIEFAHSQSIVHGDLTPGNVMIAVSGGAKVIDFGIARVFGQPAGAATMPAGNRKSGSRGEITGFSPSYASPEALELRESDPRDDIYSLACIVWELLTSSRPFANRNAKVARDEGIKLEFNDKLSRREYAALAHALNFDRDRRTASIKQFLAELTGEKSKRGVPIVVAAVLALTVAAGAYFYYSHVSRAPPSAVAAQVQSSEPVRVAEPAAAPAPTTAAPPAVGMVFRDCPTCPLMTVLPAGEFLQGSAGTGDDAQSFESPQHRVSIAQIFSASRTEITVGEYTEFAAATKRESEGCASYDGAWKVHADVQWKNAVARQTASHAVSCVSWQDASAYARWLSERTGQKYRLPSASEWEYAARAGSTAERAWSTDAEACTFGNVADQSAAQNFPGWIVHRCNDAYTQTAPVASYAANAFGLHDLLGNVFEWVEDCWHDTYEGAPADGSARRDGDCSQHEMRGGSWFTAPGFVRFAYRNRFASDYRSTSIGFRVVRVITQ